MTKKAQPKKPMGNPIIRVIAQLGNRPAKRHARRVAKFVEPLLEQGYSKTECCSALDAAGFRTWRGRRWTVSNLCNYLKAAEPKR